VLVGHSYGGLIITETGMHPDIKALVYVTAVQPDVGESLSDLAGKRPAAAKSIGPVGDGFLAVNPDAFPNDFAADAPGACALYGDSPRPASENLRGRRPRGGNVPGLSASCKSNAG
jgi:pimeloyl-ACP methyl ester carboxylesterase